MTSAQNIERQNMQVDIVCTGFGPAMGGFLTTLSRAVTDSNGQTLLSSKVAPDMPLQVLCYERADDIGFGVSGVVTLGRAIRKTFPDLDLSQIPLTSPVKKEKVVYLLDPVGKSRRSWLLRFVDGLLRAFKWMLPFYKEQAMELPLIPPFMQKHGGMLLSIGQFNQWVGSQLMGSGMVQIWPGMPVKEALIEDGKVAGVRLVDQGTDKAGKPDAGFMPGMDIHALLTVIGDGPVGPVGAQVDQHFGMPAGNHQREWALGMKAVVELPEHCELEPGTVLHTFGFPEPEIFGFLYVYKERIASLGIFVPTWFDNPIRSSYRLLQHWMMHPYLWRYLKGGTLRSWGAKTLQEAGKQGEPQLAGNGYARIGEGSGSTNVLTGSGVDEAWATGVLLAEGVIDLLKSGKPFTKENLDATYVKRRRESQIESEAKVAKKSRDGFNRGFISGMIGMAMTGFTNGLLNFPGKAKRPYERIPSIEHYFKDVLPPERIEKIRRECATANQPLHDALMDACGWPKIPFDGKLLISHQDALLIGGKVQAAGGYGDHVIFLSKETCEKCREKLCIEMCSAQAIMPGEDGGVPAFDREKCIHCGACMWNCTKARAGDPEKSNIDFRAGSGGLHSAEN